MGQRDMGDRPRDEFGGGGSMSSGWQSGQQGGQQGYGGQQRQHGQQYGNQQYGNQASGSQHRYSNIFDHERGQRGSVSGAGGMSGMGIGSQGQQGQMSSQSFRGKGPKGYSRSDQTIKDDLCEKLEDADELDPSEIDVEVERGEVKLTGTIDSRWARRYAEDLAYNVRGVKNVVNQLTVEFGEPSSSSERQAAQGNGQQRKATGKTGENQTQAQQSS